MKIRVKRYEHPDAIGYEGIIEPDIRGATWIVFFRDDGSGTLFLDRDVGGGIGQSTSIHLPAPDASDDGPDARSEEVS
jgi:hypothetical protein